MILDNLRSAHNVGAILRTAAALGVDRVYAVGTTPYPSAVGDSRLPHVAERADRQIAKTALGAEKMVEVIWAEKESHLAQELSQSGFELIAIENSADAEPLHKFSGRGRFALVLGNEIDGISRFWLEASQRRLMIEADKQKESLNVATAAAIAMYHFKFKA